MLAELVAVCLIGVSDGEVHHKNGHQNYSFENFVCSEKNLPVAPDSCGKVKDFLERPYDPMYDLLRDFFVLPAPKLTFKMMLQLQEFYDLCCLET